MNNYLYQLQYYLKIKSQGKFAILAFITSPKKAYQQQHLEVYNG